MKAYLFILFVLAGFELFSQSTKITTSSLSSQLKTEMTAAGNYPSIMDYDDIYRNGTRGVYLGARPGNKLRVMLNSNEYSDTVQESEIVRAWSKEDLVVWLVQNYSATDYIETVQGANITISFRVSGVLYTGTDNNDANAAAIAILQLL